MRLSSNEVENRNHCTQLTVKLPPLTLSSRSVPEKMLYMNKSLEASTSAFEDDTFILLAVLLNYNYCYRFSKDSVGC